MSAVAVEQLIENVNKTVTLGIVQDDQTVREVEGKLEAASEAGIAFKPKGQSGIDILMVTQVASILTMPEKPKQVAQKKLAPIKLGAARQHLLDRHGVQLSWAKAAEEKAAFDYHESLDHSDLGHKHEAKTETERDKALADDEPDTETPDEPTEDQLRAVEEGALPPY